MIRIMLPGEQVLQRKGQCHQENRYSRGKGNVTMRIGISDRRVMLPGEKVMKRLCHQGNRYSKGKGPTRGTGKVVVVYINTMNVINSV